MLTCVNFSKWLLVVVAARVALARRVRSGGRAPSGIWGDSPAGCGQAHKRSTSCGLWLYSVPVIRPALVGAAFISSSVYLLKINRRCGKKVAYESQCHSTDLNTLVTTSSCGTGGGRAVSGQRPLVKWGLGGVKLESLCLLSGAAPVH